MQSKLIVTGLTVVCCALLLTMVVHSRGAEGGYRGDRPESTTRASDDPSGMIIVSQADLDGAVEDVSATYRVLSRHIDRFKVDGMKLQDAMDLLRQKTDANIIVAWPQLVAVGVGRDAKITLDLKDARVSSILECIVREAGEGNVKLGYEARPDYILVATGDGADGNRTTVLYDVTDLELTLRSRAGEFGVRNEKSEVEAVDDLVHLIEDFVGTDSWRDNSGTIGSIREFNGMLMVTQTPDNHRRLIELLRRLRQHFKSHEFKSGATTEATLKSMLKSAATAPAEPNPATPP